MKHLRITEPFGEEGMFRGSEYFYFPASQEMLDAVKAGNEIVLRVRGQVKSKTETGDVVVAGSIELVVKEIDITSNLDTGNEYGQMAEDKEENEMANEYITMGDTD